MTPSNNGTTTSPFVLAQDAYHQMLADITRVPDEELVRINLDVLTVVTTVLGSLAELRALRERIVSELPAFDIVEFDRLELKARAMSYAHALFVSANRPAMTLPELVEAGTKTRDLLHSDAVALANRGLLDAKQFEEVKRNNGHKALAGDLQALATTLRGAWPAIAARTAVTEAEIDQALFLADRLFDAIGVREQGPPTVGEAAVIRHRAYSLLVNGYQQARRAVVYLRWDDGDADTIAPSLHAGRNGSRRAEPQVEGAEPAPEAPQVSQPPFAPVVPAGLPGSAPFLR